MPPIFDEQALRCNRRRASPDVLASHPLLIEAASDLAMRVWAIGRPFGQVLDLYSPSSLLAEQLGAEHSVIRLLPCIPFRQPVSANNTVIGDWLGLPLPSHSIDACVSLGALHNANDPLACLREMGRVLRPDGLLLANFYGGDSLFELRQSLYQADQELSGGVYPRLHPLTTVQDVGQLLQAAGFALPVVEIDEIQLLYPNLPSVLQDLQDLGERNAVTARPLGWPHRDLFRLAETIYRQRFGRGDGLLPVTVNLITMTAWSHGGNQPKPLKRGSAKNRLDDWIGL